MVEIKVEESLLIIRQERVSPEGESAIMPIIIDNFFGSLSFNDSISKVGDRLVIGTVTQDPSITIPLKFIPPKYTKVIYKIII